MAGNTRANYVIDASYLLSFLLPDERIEEVDAVFLRYREGSLDFFSSNVLPLEVINGLRSAVSSKRISPKDARVLIKNFFQIEVHYPKLDFADLFEISLEEEISVYDALYLYLARSESLRLLTLDKKLATLA